ncbi:prepilin-type N-terminal cleavage/methylation domain-containing protein [Pseudoalteromonas sp. A22]|uniref:PulJ/GspJ family protein n=1 Tax=Pseudoalteromonas TaxID=53246 RepID=UPI001BA60A05|nr:MULTISPECIES: prepilin-type N-terminal cleavage/methylation domain-containing protein [Pseudoalteromonas]QUI62398.1 prepilin-type N-terminal cleavage/methylation domain-containing protein [Pseudoalteromonas sp. A22]USE68067.1 hypothetical protein CTT31_02580 [Pseudoalteromonas flavipulchra]
MHSIKGFTLIEVLIASIILFSTIALSTQVFQGAIISSEKAADHIKISAIKMLSLDFISSEIRKGERKGSFSNMGVMVSWEANVIKKGAPPAVFNFDENQMQYFEDKFEVLEISATFQFGRLVDTMKFKELYWHEKS